ncbi:unnamed protein product [Linum trigynum]|uniref:Uncharacterized protein n=1 Tax=Linum trigynum TaxID=586398 RepID=A0AAV2EZH3_9ROSI
MIKSIKHRFGRIYSGSIFGRFQRGTIIDFGRFSEMPFSFDSGVYRSLESGCGLFSIDNESLIDPILHG